MYESAAAATQSSTVEAIKWLVPTILSVVALWKSHHDTKKARIESSTRARQQYNAELRSWINSCIATLSDAVALAMQPSLDRAQQSEMSSKLSALTDQGRLFFPNPKLGLPGKENEKAYQDFRPRILDWLKSGIDVCASIRMTPDREAGDVLFKLQRGFTSDGQAAIDPRNLFTTMDDLQQLLKQGEFMESSQRHPSLVEAHAMAQARSES